MEPPRFFVVLRYIENIIPLVDSLEPALAMTSYDVKLRHSIRHLGFRYFLIK